MKNRVLVLFTCYNRCEKTQNAIKKLEEGNEHIIYGFIAVDGGSTDGTLGILKLKPEIDIVSPDETVFYSGGMRYAINKAQNRLKSEPWEYVLLINDDVDFFEGSIEKLIAFSNANNCIAVGPTCDTNGKLSYGGVRLLSRFSPKFQIMMDGECDTFNANCVLIPKHIFEKLDNIDSIYRHSLGDFDYGLSAGRKGYSIQVFNDFVGVCNDNPSDGTWRDRSLPICKRIKLKESVKGVPTAEWFHYLHKNYNIFTAIIYTMSGYIRIFLKK